MTKFNTFITTAGAFALIAGLNIGMAPQAYAWDCLLDTNNDGDVDLTDTDGSAESGGFSTELACGSFSSATGGNATALGFSSNAAGSNSTALGYVASAAGFRSTALGNSASAAGGFSTAVGRDASAAGSRSTALGYGTDAGLNAIALGGDSNDFGGDGAQALGDNSIIIGVDASDGLFTDTVVIGFGAVATQADQVILKDAATFTILGNGNMGVGTATPAGNLDINSGALDTTLLLSNTSAQWELKSKAATGRLNFKNLTAGGVPFKLGPTAVNSLLSVGTATADLVEVRGDLDVTGILTTGGPTCGGGCDAVFDADYDLPSIEEHAARMFANKHLPEIGPTVPYAPINISEQYGRVINELEKAHIYIAQIQAEKKSEISALEARLEQQTNRLEQTNARLERLEKLLTP